MDMKIKKIKKGGEVHGEKRKKKRWRRSSKQKEKK